MSDYTPTTEEVRDCWAWEHTYTGFDRWLADVKAQAWEEGWKTGYSDGYNDDLDTVNPYRQGEN